MVYAAEIPYSKTISDTLKIHLVANSMSGGFTTWAEGSNCQKKKATKGCQCSTFRLNCVQNTKQNLPSEVGVILVFYNSAFIWLSNYTGLDGLISSMQHSYSSPQKHVIPSHRLKRVFISCWTKITPIFALRGAYRFFSWKNTISWLQVLQLSFFSHRPILTQLYIRLWILPTWVNQEGNHLVCSSALTNVHEQCFFTTVGLYCF